jgi:hypothetical protein
MDVPSIAYSQDLTVTFVDEQGGKDFSGSSNERWRRLEPDLVRD